MTNYDRERELAKLAQEITEARVSRGDLLKRAAALGIGASGFAALVAACGGDDEGGAAAPPPPAEPPAEPAPAEPPAAEPPAEGESKGQIAFSHPFTTNPVRIAVVEFAREHTESRGYEFLTEESNAQLDRQVAAIEAWIQQGVDAMVILPLEPAALEELAMRARDAGIKFLTYAIEMENQDGSVGFNNPQGGRILGEAAGNWINETLGGEAKVGILTFTPLEVANQRTDNYEAAILELAPNAQIVGKQDASTVEEGLAVTETFLQANPDLNVVLGINDDSAVGAYQAFINAGHPPDDPSVFIGGTDGTEDAFRLIQEGGMYRASAALDLRGLAAQSIDAAIAAVEEGRGGTTTIDFTLVTADDPELLEEFLAPYE